MHGLQEPTSAIDAAEDAEIERLPLPGKEIFDRGGVGREQAAQSSADQRIPGQGCSVMLARSSEDHFEAEVVKGLDKVDYVDRSRIPIGPRPTVVDD
jgi:hypothetical protein